MFMLKIEAAFTVPLERAVINLSEVLMGIPETKQKHDIRWEELRLI